MSQLYVAVLAIIVVALLAVALYRTSQVKTKADYLVAGRSLPAWSWCSPAHLVDRRRIAFCRCGERLQERLCRTLAAGWRMAGATAHLLYCPRRADSPNSPC